MSSDKEQTEPRYWGVYEGTVVNNADPEGVGRVTVRVPGVLGGESGWAYPMGLPGGGGPQRGLFDVPSQGASVYVQFLGGDPQRPLWSAGHWGSRTKAGNEVPTPLKGAKATDADKIKAYETDRWLITYDDRPASATLTLTDKISGDVIELDGHAMGILISGTTQVNIKSLGVVSIDGATVQIAGRNVLKNGKPI